jgi:hypothetical protein
MRRDTSAAPRGRDGFCVATGQFELASGMMRRSMTRPQTGHGLLLLAGTNSPLSRCITFGSRRE